MNRLHTEWCRLYQTEFGPPRLFDDHGLTRAAVLEVPTPADDGAVAALWSAVQSRLHLPAPAIAVDGRAAMQLWFSFAQPVDTDTARRFLVRLVERCEAGIAPGRLRLWPQADPERHADPIPAEQAVDERWSAFVAPDLAPLFLHTPWLDIPPGDAAQARILAGLASIGPAQLQAVLQTTPGAADLRPGAAPSPRAVPAAGPGLDPRGFLQSVLDDVHAPLALRVQAAAALLGRPADEPT